MRRAAAAQAAEADRGAGGPARSAGTGSVDRPPAPWGSFPLSELVVLLALLLGVAGLIVWGDRGRTMVAAAAALGSLAGLELAIREHFGGYRSHSTLLAAAAAIASMIGLLLLLGNVLLGVVVAVGALAFAVVFWALRRVFRRRSGGLSFR